MESTKLLEEIASTLLKEQDKLLDENPTLLSSDLNMLVFVRADCYDLIRGELRQYIGRIPATVDIFLNKNKILGSTVLPFYPPPNEDVASYPEFCFSNLTAPNLQRVKLECKFE